MRLGETVAVERLLLGERFRCGRPRSASRLSAVPRHNGAMGGPVKRGTMYPMRCYLWSGPRETGRST